MTTVFTQFRTVEPSSDLRDLTSNWNVYVRQNINEVSPIGHEQKPEVIFLLKFGILLTFVHFFTSAM